MQPACLSVRVNARNRRHHLWCNNGTWWMHFTLNTLSGHVRRVRRSLGTRDLAEATLRRDLRLAAMARDGAWVS
ncbi:MAG: succinylarginine dihydrolase [Pseudohongiellaceae bacterium]|jgi:succinylarginine dihydrolase